MGALSAEDVELVRSLNPGPELDLAPLFKDDEAATRWRDEVAPLFDPAVKVSMRLPGLPPVVYKGLRGVCTAWRDMLRHRTSYRNEVEDVIDRGERIAVIHRGYSRDRPEGPESVHRRVTIWTLHDGRIIGVDFNVPYTDAFPAVGAAN
jgi:hypothetical protein